MGVTLRECMALLRYRSSFELTDWHMSLTAIMIRACVRTVIVGIGVRSRCKCRVIRVIELTASKVLCVRVVA